MHKLKNWEKVADDFYWLNARPTLCVTIRYFPSTSPDILTSWRMQAHFSDKPSYRGWFESPEAAGKFAYDTFNVRAIFDTRLYLAKAGLNGS